MRRISKCKAAAFSAPNTACFLTHLGHSERRGSILRVPDFLSVLHVKGLAGGSPWEIFSCVWLWVSHQSANEQSQEGKVIVSGESDMADKLRMTSPRPEATWLELIYFPLVRNECLPVPFVLTY